jgi:hypothetical protein
MDQMNPGSFLKEQGITGNALQLLHYLYFKVNLDIKDIAD